MSEILFKKNQDVTDNWLAYVQNEAEKLAQSDEFTIRNYADSELLNPLVQNYLSEATTEEAGAFELESFSLGFNEAVSIISVNEASMKIFGGLKEKIRRVFCRIVSELRDIDIKSIIKAVLVALIPVFAGGVPAIALPIVVGLIAMLLKYGVQYVCPV